MATERETTREVGMDGIELLRHFAIMRLLLYAVILLLVLIIAELQWPGKRHG